MSGTPATTARPPGAAIAWVANGSLFVEYPTRSGVPYVVRYKLTLTDLTTALNILVENSDAPVPTPQVEAKPHPAVRKVASFTEDQREGVREVMKRMKII